MPINIRAEFKKGFKAEAFKKKANRLKESKTAAPQDNKLDFSDVGKLEDFEAFDDKEESKKHEHSPP